MEKGIGTKDPEGGPPVGRRSDVKQFLGPLVGVALFAFALFALHRELAGHSFHEILEHARRLPAHDLLAALALVFLNYAVLAAYDSLALRYAERRLPYRRTVFASFVSYAVSNSLGLSFLSGGALRWRLYGAWGLSAVEVAQVMLFNAITLWLGLALGGGMALMWAPPTSLLPIMVWRVVGVGLLATAVFYGSWSWGVRKPLRILQWELRPPSGALASVQFAVSLADWMLSGLTLYVLLPPETVGLWTFMGAYLAAQAIGLASQIPGGLGVFEIVLISSLGGRGEEGALAAALVAFRGLYYVLPLACAGALLGIYEFRQNIGPIKVAAGTAARWAAALTPAALSVLTFAGGVVLLVSGATPPEAGRLAWLGKLFPLPFIEASHLVGSLAGTGLLLLAWGLHRRLEAARVAAVVLAAAGALASLLKGGDFEEALVMVGLLTLLLPARKAFYRRSRLMAEPLSPGWLAAVALAAGGAAWLGFFAHRHVEYSRELWWRFALEEDAPRFLRALLAMGTGLGVFGFWRLLAPSPPEPVSSTPADIDKAAALAADSVSTSAWLALLGDKDFLFGDRAFLMFAVRGGTWVSMGDPVGPEDEVVELAWRFKEAADRHGGRVAFYEVGPERLPLYLDMGLQLLKLGEEARVPLREFDLAGPKMKELRYVARKMEREGLAFEVRSADAAAPLMSGLKAISDRWLESKHTREKSFSLGRFREGYLARFPMALILKEGRPIAFANVWLGGMNEELSVDLMRHEPEAPSGVMDYLFVSLMAWGRAKGYGWFNMGMAPFSGFDKRPLSPMWGKIGGLLYRHGEHFFNFQGLRHYKEKFHPAWRPKYLASRGGLALPGLLADIAALISGGLKGVVAK